jgi:small subunit ribosomal protein S1
VVRVAEFGAFIQIAPGVDGLVHISEVSRKRIGKVDEVLKVDQVVTARVLKIDPTTRKISLSLKVLQAEEPPAPGSREAVMSEKRAARDKAAQDRLKEIQKETPELRRQREKFRNKSLTGGFGKGMEFLGGGLGDLKL